MNDDQGATGAPDFGGQTPPADTAAENPQVLSPSVAAVSEALGALEPVERDLILDAFRGASYREIAADRRLSEATVKSTIRRGLTRIGAILRKIRTGTLV